MGTAELIRVCVARPLVMTLLGMLLTAGCGGPIEFVPVTGRVTVDGGAVPAEGAIYFQPLEPVDSYVARPGFARFDASGNYTAVTGSRTGLVPGHYQVGVECWKAPPNMEGKPVISHILTKYQAGATSGIELRVEATRDVRVFDIDVARKP